MRIIIAGDDKPAITNKQIKECFAKANKAICKALAKCNKKQLEKYDGNHN